MKVERRGFIKTCLSGIVAVPAVLLIGTQRALGLTPADPTKGTAKAIGYSKKFKDPKKRCDNCNLYVPATKGCLMLAGMTVEPKGTCNSWSGPKDHSKK